MLPANESGTSAVVVALESARTGDAERLLRSAEAELRQRYHDYEPTPMQPEIVEQNGAALFVARRGGVAVGGIVALPWSENRSGAPVVAELKRLWVSPQIRGRGVAKALLQAIESWARGSGYGHVVLETGIGQPEALALYDRCGYESIACWGEYADDDVSVCYAKSLVTGVGAVSPPIRE